MSLDKVLYTANVGTPGSWKNIFMKHPLLRLGALRRKIFAHVGSMALGQVSGS